MQNTQLLRRAILFGAIILLIAQSAATLMIIGRAREAQIHAAEDSVERISLATETSINRALCRWTQCLRAAGNARPFLAERADGHSSAEQVLRQLNNQNFTYRDILLMGPNGLPLATALPVSRRRRLPLPVETGFSELVERGGGVSIGGPVRIPRPASGRCSLRAT